MRGVAVTGRARASRSDRDFGFGARSGLGFAAPMGIGGERHEAGGLGGAVMAGIGGFARAATKRNLSAKVERAVRCDQNQKENRCGFAKVSAHN